MITTVLKTVLKKEKKIPDTISQSPDWQTYRTRFTIRARVLSAPLNFVDALGREQNGKRGDYLVESNGMVTITPRHIFEDVYVPLDAVETHVGRIALSNQAHVGTAAFGRPAERSSAAPPRKSPISTTKRPFFPAQRRRSV